MSGKAKLTDAHLAAIVKQHPNSQRLVDAILEQRKLLRERNQENQKLNLQVEQLERDKRNMALEMDRLKRRNAELESLYVTSSS